MRTASTKPGNPKHETSTKHQSGMLQTLPTVKLETWNLKLLLLLTPET
jgi:hypothetical protein